MTPNVTSHKEIAISRRLGPGIPVISNAKAAAIIGVDRTTLWRLMRQGEIASRIVSVNANGAVRKTSEAEAIRYVRSMNGGSN